MKTTRLLKLYLTLFLTVTAMAQQPGSTRMAISGYVSDASTGSPIQYSNVMLYDESTSNAITGTITDQMGRFVISPVSPGKYYVRINFMGFDETRIDSIYITMATPELELGKLTIKPAIIEGGSVVVERERTTMEYKIDKKVINVGQDFTSSSGSAVEVLENVPSVTVDIDGNVSLRGSTNFTVLVDNRPSILDANDALQTIPASTIDNIEIITNPSAAFDPDGVSGIINIITKKSRLEGISGIANVNAGMFGRLGTDVLVNYRNHRYTTYLSAAYSVGGFESVDTTLNETSIGDTTYYVDNYGERHFARGGYRVRTGLDYNLTDNDLLGVQLSIGSWGMNSTRTSNSAEYLGDASSTTNPLYSITENDGGRGGTYVNTALDFEHRFNGANDHRLEARINYTIRDFEEEWKFEQFSANDSIIEGRITTEAGPTQRTRLDIKYEQPIGNEGNLEGGYLIRSGISIDNSGLQVWNQTSESYDVLSEYEKETEYRRFIQALYGVASNNFGNFGIQAGFRAEYTLRNIGIVNSSEFEINRWDFFPTAHLSYNITPESKFMASYSRRIDRPRGWYLEPFETWSDAYNVRIGNPNLDPEYINAMEAGFMRYFGKNMISAEIYSRETLNLIESVRSVYAENIILQSFENIGKSLSVGSELSLRMMPLDWWDFNLMGNIYHYQIKDQPDYFDRNLESNNWRARFNNNFTLSKAIKLQLNAMYNSPTITAQGRSESSFTLNAGARLTLIDNKLTATINVRDVLDSGIHTFTSSGDDFYRYSVSDRIAPVFSATLKYNFNNYKSSDQNGRDDDAGGDDF